MPPRNLLTQLPSASGLKCLAPTLKICLKDFTAKGKQKSHKEIHCESGNSLLHVYHRSLQNAAKLVHQKA